MGRESIEGREFVMFLKIGGLMKKILYLNAFLLLAIASSGQPVIRGVVTDTRSRQPLESASIAEAEDPGAPGSPTFTYSHGNFCLKLRHGTAKLRVSDVGYKQECITVKSGDSLTIELQPDM